MPHPLDTKIQGLGGSVHQVGDHEVSGTIPIERITEALVLIRASRLRPGNAQNLKRAPAQDAYVG